MQLNDGRPLFAATDLVAFAECHHLSHLEWERFHGRFGGALRRDETVELIARKGDEHERAYLERLKTDGRSVVEIASSADPAQLAVETTLAMERGAEVIFQGVLVEPPWRGQLDFLYRVERPSSLGSWSYEAADTKLAHRAKPGFLVQLCLYSELLGTAQGVDPELMHVILGSGHEERHRVQDFAPYVRHLRARFERQAERGFEGTYPHRVERCGVCHFQEHCETRREADDHLSLVANMRRGQIDRLGEMGIETTAELAASTSEDRPPRMSQTAFSTLRHQAELQIHERTTGERRMELLPPQDDRGFALLPPPDPGDVVFDIEGDPLFEGGLEYLFGVGWEVAGAWEFRPFWARDRADERRAFEQLVDFLIERITSFPGMRIYHYGAYETAAIRRLMGLHGTREDEVDRLLRERRLVDLYSVVRQALRLSSVSYSIKKVEAFYAFERTADVGRGDDSIVAFERFLETGDEDLLGQIQDYNEEDCLSTLRLLEWLRARRVEAIERFGDISWASPGAAEEEPEPPDPLAEALTEAISDDWAPDPELPHLGLRDADEHGRWLMAQLLHYHRREAKPEWWRYFERLRTPPSELVDDRDALGDLEPSADEPVPVKSSLEYTLTFPPQEHRIASRAIDASTGGGVAVTGFDDELGTVTIKRAAKRQGEPLPRALIPNGPINTDAQRAAVRRVGESVIKNGLRGPGAFSAARSLVARRPSGVGGTALIDGPVTPEALAELVRTIEGGSLMVQGPPGAGKTWTAARAIVHLVAGGLRVGVASTSHKAIHNLLEQVEGVAADRKVALRGLKKSSASPESHFVSVLDEPLIENSSDSADFPPLEDVSLVAGTAWLFAREEMTEAVDVLIVDEAGQVSLADAVALATAASRIVLLGDPQQLAHVSQGTHPPGASASVLEHLLGDRATVPSDAGVFLDLTWRMHPDVCGFVSVASYEGRLRSEKGCSDQSIASPGLSGSGVRFLPVEHRDNQRSSAEEADVVRHEVELLLEGHYTDRECAIRPLRHHDILVVAPYNAQVQELREVLPDGVEVGTVDKFQGRDAPVVVFSMATSSGEDVPRNLAFLLSLNRLNVAVSRARALAVVIASPELLAVRCRRVEEMRLASALCLLSEVAAEQVAAAAPQGQLF